MHGESVRQPWNYTSFVLYTGVQQKSAHLGPAIRGGRFTLFPTKDFLRYGIS